MIYSEGTTFPAEPITKQETGLLWGLPLQPMKKRIPRVCDGSNADDLLRCANCFAFVNNSCDWSEKTWTCCICKTENKIKGDRYKKFKLLPDELKIPFLEFKILSKKEKKRILKKSQSKAKKDPKKRSKVKKKKIKKTITYSSSTSTESENEQMEEEEEEEKLHQSRFHKKKQKQSQNEINQKFKTPFAFLFLIDLTCQEDELKTVCQSLLITLKNLETKAFYRFGLITIDGNKQIDVFDLTSRQPHCRQINIANFYSQLKKEKEKEKQRQKQNQNENNYKQQQQQQQQQKDSSSKKRIKLSDLFPFSFEKILPPLKQNYQQIRSAILSLISLQKKNNKKRQIKKPFGDALHLTINFLRNQDQLMLSKIFCFLGSPPNYGKGKISIRRLSKSIALQDEKFAFQPQTSFYTKLAVRASQNGIQINLFCFNFVGLSSLSSLATKSGGKIIFCEPNTQLINKTNFNNNKDIKKNGNEYENENQYEKEKEKEENINLNTKENENENENENKNENQNINENQNENKNENKNKNENEKEKEIELELINDEKTKKIKFDKISNELLKIFTIPKAARCMIRIRTSQGYHVSEILGNYCKHKSIEDLLLIPECSSNNGLAVYFDFDNKKEGFNPYEIYKSFIQVTFAYSKFRIKTKNGQQYLRCSRYLRIHTSSFPISFSPIDILKSARLPEITYLLTHRLIKLTYTFGVSEAKQLLAKWLIHISSKQHLLFYVQEKLSTKCLKFSKFPNLIFISRILFSLITHPVFQTIGLHPDQRIQLHNVFSLLYPELLIRKLSPRIYCFDGLDQLKKKKLKLSKVAIQNSILQYKNPIFLIDDSEKIMILLIIKPNNENQDKVIANGAYTYKEFLKGGSLLSKILEKNLKLRNEEKSTPVEIHYIKKNNLFGNKNICLEKYLIDDGINQQPSFNKFKKNLLVSIENIVKLSSKI
ncbi:hypothetical protein M0813_01615 [Anaeramoeba flamelloides]|uniref:Sec23/Sec24 trunk domain-containing protein n=1 Tax=Anaeramoeba flamelloides TaxID=1746091 RepID=A0ABQ8Z534_9EUKA|nr:hypothetical protein M0813_01615 [Anaeramoeba flamelloides]